MDLSAAPVLNTKMELLLNNTRYILELERIALIQEKYAFDQKYGTFSFAFLTSLESLALLAYFYTSTVLIYYKKTRTKTNFIISVWAAINFAVMLQKLSRDFGGLIGDDFLISEDVACLSQIMAGLGRNYGALLSIVWLFSRYFDSPKPKYNFFIYFLMSVPAIVCFYHVYYFLAVEKYIYEAYGPTCDVINAIVYLSVGLLFVLCKIFINASHDTSQYPLMISIVNLVTNFPGSLITIYVRFNLDIAWSYRFHIYFVEFFVNVLSCSNAFAVLFIIMLCNKDIRQSLFLKQKDYPTLTQVEIELTKMSDDCRC